MFDKSGFIEAVTKGQLALNIYKEEFNRNEKYKKLLYYKHIIRNFRKFKQIDYLDKDIILYKIPEIEIVSVGLFPYALDVGIMINGENYSSVICGPMILFVNDEILDEHKQEIRNMVDTHNRWFKFHEVKMVV